MIEKLKKQRKYFKRYAEQHKGDEHSSDPQKQQFQKKAKEKVETIDEILERQNQKPEQE